MYNHFNDKSGLKAPLIADDIYEIIMKVFSPVILFLGLLHYYFFKRIKGEKRGKCSCHSHCCRVVMLQKYLNTLQAGKKVKLRIIKSMVAEIAILNEKA